MTNSGNQMAAQQRIIRVRRTYNQWVANQTLEDYALRFTAKSARRWSAIRVANTAIGAISFLALEAIGAAITLSYGFTNAVAAILVVGLLIFLTGLPIAYYAVKYGVDIDLLTRGAGFGYIGSTVTSLIYASFTFIFFALEAAIMATALELCFGVPLLYGYLICAIVIIPLVIFGISLISRLQVWTQPLWIVLQLLPFAFIGLQGVAPLEGWQSYSGQLGATDGSFDILLFGAASAVVFSLIAQIGEQVDFLRFLPHQKHGQRLKWWSSMLCAGPGWIVIGVIKLLMGSFLVVVALNNGIAPSLAVEPTHMYLAAFSFVASPEIAIALTGIFVITCQIKINVTNSYAGSIAWSNFFSRLTHSHPGRAVWLVFNVAIALTLMELGVYKALEGTLGLYSIVAVAWVGALVADLVINKRLGLSPPYIEFKRAHLYDINPVGVGAMSIASVVALVAYSGLLGETAHALASFIALGVSMTLAPLLAYWTKGRYYIARQPEPFGKGARAPETVRCCICEHSFETEDMAHCPVYAGPICSLCCSLDARCGDSCKEDARITDQILHFLRCFLPEIIVKHLNSRVGRYLGIMLLLSLALGAVLSLIHYGSTFEDPVQGDAAARALTQVFLILLVIFGVIAWLFILAHESQLFAGEETQRQTSLLMREIRAHHRTDRKLQKAKESAEAANLAKSRYVTGISHELRSPLNAIMGYAQLLQMDPAIPESRRDAVDVIQHSADHLAGLIEGLLDISKIEAGHLTIYRNRINLDEFLVQIVNMFSLQAATKSLGFVFAGSPQLPPYVHGDEKRLRQVLINLLSNALKNTELGEIRLAVTYRNEIAEFTVSDTGVGIAADNLERIFRPFERITDGNDNTAPPGTGLGLTITRLLTEVMGGEISVYSTPGQGSTFKVKLMLASANAPASTARGKRQIRGYEGPRLTIMAVEDDAAHRQLLEDLLTPLGFNVIPAANGAICLELAKSCRPDVFLLDISMPGMTGWELAAALRQNNYEQAVIIMISADADESGGDRTHQALHDDYLVKPFQLSALLERLQEHLKIEWVTDVTAAGNPTPFERFRPPAQTVVPSDRHINVLKEFSKIGYISGIRAKLDEIERVEPETAPFIAHMRRLIKEFDIKSCDRILDTLGDGND